MSWHVLKLDLNSARWMPKLVSIDAQSYRAFTSQSLRATIGPLQDNWPQFHYVIGISGILPNNRNVTLQTLGLFSVYARLYNAAASPALRLRSAGSLAITWICECRHATWQQSAYQIALKSTEQYDCKLFLRLDGTCNSMVELFNSTGRDFDLTIKFSTSTGEKEYCEWFVSGTEVAFDIKQVGFTLSWVSSTVFPRPAGRCNRQFAPNGSIFA